MAHQKGCHAKTGCVADAQMTLEVAINARAADMFGQIMGEPADQPDSQHLGHERSGKPRTLFDHGAVCNAEFTIAINGCGPHQIADVSDHLRIWLIPTPKPFNDMIKKPHGFVGAAQNQIAFGETPGFLKRCVGNNAFDFSIIGDAVIKDICGIPSFREHPVRALIGGQIGRDRNQ